MSENLWSCFCGFRGYLTFNSAIGSARCPLCGKTESSGAFVRTTIVRDPNESGLQDENRAIKEDNKFLSLENVRLRAELNTMRKNHPENHCYDAMPRRQAALQGLADALASVTNHLAQVLDGPIMRGCGVSFPDGTDNVPSIKQARAALKNAEPFLKKETT